jgi:hypothetical protein
MNGFLPYSFIRIGRAGKITGIGKAKETGEFRVINLGLNNRGRN